jgi:hypothetical protein
LRLRRRLRRLLRIVGPLPLVLSRRPCLPTRLTIDYEMAGSDKVDPAIPCLLAASRRIARAQANATMMAWRVSNLFKKC